MPYPDRDPLMRPAAATVYPHRASRASAVSSNPIDSASHCRLLKPYQTGVSNMSFQKGPM